MPRVVVPADPRQLYRVLAAALGVPGSADLDPDSRVPGCAPAVVALQPLVHDPAALPPDAALVVRTSGSTGTPREVVLTRDALRASIEATAARLGGHGRWFLALPWHHVAGAQVVARSVVARTTPGSLPEGTHFTAELFAEHAERFLDDPAARSYVSLVPTQLHRIVEAARSGAASEGSPDGARAAHVLRRFDAVLLGGASTPRALLDEARALGVHVVTTYGMSETCGGCVYDDVPLDGVRVHLDADGRIELEGPMVAWGYLGDAAATAEAFPSRGTGGDGMRRFRTSDVGELVLGDAGRPRRLRVLGRLDDVIVTGGAKVSPLAVEHALHGFGEVCVVGVDDPEWGQSVVAVVAAPGTGSPQVAPPDLRDRVRATARELVGPSAAPRHVLVASTLPMRGPGKVDRRALAASAADVVRTASD